MEEVDRYYQGNITLEEAENYIASGLITAARAYVANGYYLRRIRDDRLYEEAGYKNFEEYVRAKYNKDKGWASKCIKVNQELSADGNSPILISNYQDYSVYQLVEIAYMTEEQREEADPDMTVQALKEIRNPKPRAEEKVVTSQLEERSVEPEPDAEAQQIEESIAISQQDPEKLSAYGTSIKVYPEDSLLTTPGCEGGHDCFLCHLQCDIRQEYCRCVEATIGNPCEQIDRIDTLREEIGKRCQFIDLDQAYHRAGDHEPVPCCKECKEPCQYACERSIEKRETEPQECSIDSASCIHRDGYECTLPHEAKLIPGDGNECSHSCCWECRYHGACEYECHASANRNGERPEFNPAWFVRQWAERNPADLKKVMKICKECTNNSLRAKEIQKYMAPCGYSGKSEPGYSHTFHSFAGGIEFGIGRVTTGMKYGRFVVELMELIPEYEAPAQGILEFEEPEQIEPEPDTPEIKPEILHVYEDQQPDESWKFGDLPQAKEKYVKSLVQILVEKRGKLLKVNMFSSTLEDERIKWKLEDLAEETNREIEIGEGVVACPCEQIIEFVRGTEDLGVCSYARFSTKVQKALEEWTARQDSAPAPVKPADPDPVIDADFEEVSEDRPYTIDMVMTEIIRWKDRRESSKPGGTEPSEIMYKKACMMYDAMMALHASMGGEYDEIA